MCVGFKFQSFLIKSSHTYALHSLASNVLSSQGDMSCCGHAEHHALWALVSWLPNLLWGEILISAPN